MLYKGRGLVVVRKFGCLLFILLSACSLRKDAGSANYLLPWPDANGEYSLQAVPIETLTSPTQISGPAAEVFVNPTFTAQGVSSPIARPHLTRVNDLYVPLDAASGLALSAYAIFERIYQFENRVLGPTLLSWPRHVGVETRLYDGTTGAVETNNARFYGDQGIVAFFPYSAKGLPLALNASIVSHEHFHAHFYKAVLEPSLGGPYVAKSEDQVDVSRHDDYNFMVLRAWNEGLADFYAAVFTRAPKMMYQSLEFTFADDRDVSAPFQRFQNPQEFRASLLQRPPPPGSLALARPPTLCFRSVCSYRQGTELARFLYGFSGADAESVLAHVIHRLPEIARHIQESYTQRDWSIEEAVRLLLKDYPLNESKCAVLKSALSESEWRRSFGACLERR